MGDFLERYNLSHYPIIICGVYGCTSYITKFGEMICMRNF